MGEKTITINYCLLKLQFLSGLDNPRSAMYLRGALGSLPESNPLFHQHHASGDRIYHTPLIQYKVIEGSPIIVGIGPGAFALGNCNLVNKKLRLGDCEREVITQETAFTSIEIGYAPTVLEYSFASPWIALNQDNYKAYIRSGNHRQRMNLLERVLIGNTISFSKGIGYNVDYSLECRLSNLSSHELTFKNTPLLGFRGQFCINYRFPDYWGIGKSASQGFGTILANSPEKS